MRSKKIKKVVFLITVLSTIATIIGLTYDYLLPIYLSFKFHTDLSDAASVGIIGGADGPTTIYVSSSQDSHLITAIFALLSIAGVTYLILTKRKKDSKNSES